MWESGEVVQDTRTGRVGRVMGHIGPRYQLRPLNGGREWEADPEEMSPAQQSDAFRDRVAEANQRSRAHRPRSW
ncbi:hypothetical protein Q5762_04880 [Streptomyces sp. P9(2023)]|nr:hypothetical protein [Streptomyces sp. P9(2023)]